jgi:hypothetical protein
VKVVPRVRYCMLVPEEYFACNIDSLADKETDYGTKSF